MFIRALSVYQGGTGTADIIIIIKELVAGCYLRMAYFVVGLLVVASALVCETAVKGAIYISIIFTLISLN